MTLDEAIVHLDELKHNTYSQSQKRRWLSDLDGRVHAQILSTHQPAPEPFSGYDAATPGSRVLLVEAPYEEIYLRYLEMELDYHNGEIEKYNNSSLLFQAAWDAFSRYYHRTHTPAGKSWQFP